MKVKSWAAQITFTYLTIEVIFKVSAVEADGQQKLLI